MAFWPRYESYYIGMHLGVVPLYRLSQMSFCLSPRVSEWRFDIYESYYVGIRLGVVPLFRLSSILLPLAMCLSFASSFLSSDLL